MALQIPAANHAATGRRTRSLRTLTPCFERVDARRKTFVLDAKPVVLKHLGAVEKKVWKQYQTHLGRVSPLARAEFYARQMKIRGLRSFRGLAQVLGEPVAKVSQHIKLLGLPELVQRFLRESKNPAHLRYFCEPRLRELLKLKDVRGAWRRFREMLSEADREAGVWTSIQT